MSDAMHQIGEDIAQGYDDVARGIARMTKHLRADAGSAIAASANTLVEAASDLADKVRSESAALPGKLNRQIHEHPVATAALAAAVAGVLGYAAATRRQRRRAAAHACECGNKRL